MTHHHPSKYCAKEYHGDRPCIDPLTMAELRLRCASGSPPKRDVFTRLRTLWQEFKDKPLVLLP
jgi:hypothetical protein